MSRSLQNVNLKILGVACRHKHAEDLPTKSARMLTSLIRLSLSDKQSRSIMAWQLLSSSQLLLLVRSLWSCIAIIYMSCYLSSQLSCCVYQYYILYTELSCLIIKSLAIIKSFMWVTYPSCSLMKYSISCQLSISKGYRLFVNLGI